MSDNLGDPEFRAANEGQQKAGSSPPPASRPQLVLAFTGPLGSGVSTFTKLLSRDGFTRVSLSDAIKREYQNRNTINGQLHFTEKENPGWRQKLQDIGDEGRLKGLDYWLTKALEGVPHDAELAIDGIRNAGEIRALRSIYPNCHVVAVLASRSTRWERVKTDYNDLARTFDKDDLRDSDEDLNHGQQVEKCVQEADYVLWNEVDLKPVSNRDKQLLDRIRPEILLMRGQQGRRPSPEEINITSAYSHSYSSRCLKRFVGAVIVDVNGLPISVGFNENPVGMLPCELGYKYCFKDADMEAKLENLHHTHCPDCGKGMSDSRHHGDAVLAGLI